MGWEGFMSIFQNRADAGRRLAEKLKSYQKENPFILALPRGGVPIGYEVAQALHAPLDVFVVRKVGSPWNPEYGIGAVAPGVLVLDKASLQELGITPPEIQGVIEREQEEVNRRQRLYRGNEDHPTLADKTVILIDDGIATGVTTHVAIQAIKQHKPKKLILAVPVGPKETIAILEKQVDDLICLEMPSHFFAVGSYYVNFPQVSDEEVITLLKQARDK
ncbi:MAG: phosphoribosyltransferase [Alphaproteobacteria bacterium]|nr:phosphoribosyltransferase [Alphaproteobacteria bacterium]